MTGGGGAWTVSGGQCAVDSTGGVLRRSRNVVAGGAHRLPPAPCRVATREISGGWTWVVPPTRYAQRSTQPPSGDPLFRVSFPGHPKPAKLMASE